MGVQLSRRERDDIIFDMQMEGSKRRERERERWRGRERKGEIELTFKKSILDGEARNRMMSSIENQMIHIVSVRKKGSVMDGTSSSMILVLLYGRLMIL